MRRLFYFFTRAGQEKITDSTLNQETVIRAITANMGKPSLLNILLPPG
jgi:hypothetical protein